MSFAVEIEKLVYGGHGLARVNGRVVLTPFVLPGEKVIVEPEKETPGLIEARPIALEAGADWRVEAQCPYFTICGGCHYQHMPYERQLEFKRLILLETLARLGKIEWTEPVEVIAAEPWAYRNRVQLRVRKQRGRFEIGYFRFGSHRLEPIDFCPISSPAINRAISAIRRMGPSRRFPDFLRELELFTNERDVQLNVLERTQPIARRFFEWCAEEIEGFSMGTALECEAGGDLYRVSSRSFFQVNRFLVSELPEAALVGGAGGGTAVDLYAGVGLFSLKLARQFSRTVALDANRSAVRDLEFNAQRAGLTVEAHHGGAEAFLADFAAPVDLVLADPPRAGLGRGVTAALSRLRPRRLVIVSCDPATLARDLRALIDAKYRLICVKMVDLFPQTYHIESVVELISDA